MEILKIDTNSSILGIYTKDNRKDWHETLPYLTHVIYSAFSPTINDNPSYVLFGRTFEYPMTKL